MGQVRKIKSTELIHLGEEVPIEEDVYPITSTLGVYDLNGNLLDLIINDLANNSQLVPIKEDVNKALLETSKNTESINNINKDINTIELSVSKKLNKLIAGSNIKIDSYNRISAEGYNYNSSNKSIAFSGGSATGDSSFALGSFAKAEGSWSFAIGTGTLAKALSSHAEGRSSKALGDVSHAEGSDTIAKGYASHAEGQYNVGDSLFIYSLGIGNHAGPLLGDLRKNAHTITYDGKHYIPGIGGYTGTETYQEITDKGIKDVVTVINTLNAKIEDLENRPANSIVYSTPQDADAFTTEDVIQYIGKTLSVNYGGIFTFTKGYFYECIENSDKDVFYEESHNSSFDGAIDISKITNLKYSKYQDTLNTLLSIERENLGDPTINSISFIVLDDSISDAYNFVCNGHSYDLSKENDTGIIVSQANLKLNDKIIITGYPKREWKQLNVLP